MPFSAKALRVLALLWFTPAIAMATDGYFDHGYGVKSQGIGGLGIALPQDGLAIATNPAGIALVGDRVDAGASWFVPQRGAEITGNALPINGSYSGDGRKNFLIPEFAYTRQLSSSTTVGVAVYGNGGMNTTYDSGIPLFGNTPAGVNLEQLFVSPALAWRLDEHNAVGIAVNFAYQLFEAKGLQNFAQAGSSASPANVTDQGSDTSTGWGLHLGWTGQLAPDWTIGATWSSKIKASKFDKYKGLFADSGSFDIPANFGAGLSYKATPALTLAADVERIQYGQVSSVGNPLANLFGGNLLGSPNGAGFGWKDVSVYKLGLSYDFSTELTLRGGFNHSDQPIPASETLFNILAPGVVQDHLTLGATWKRAGGDEVSVAYAHGFRGTVNGSGSIPPGFPPAGFGGGEANIHLEENQLGVAYAWKL